MGTADSALRSLIRRGLNGYTAIPAIEAAEAVSERLGRQRHSATVCCWDVDVDPPDRYREHTPVLYTQCRLPERWRRSLIDADRAVETGLRVPIVKGEWAGLKRGLR